MSRLRGPLDALPRRLETTRVNLSTGLKLLNSRYARRFNRRHNRFGHVFAERFQARVIESEEYLYDACEYVAQNPVAAGLCDAPEDWPWSYRRDGRLAGGPAFLREEEAVPRAVRAAEADEQREARERPALPDAAVLEHRRLRVVDGVARAGRPAVPRPMETPTQSLSHVPRGLGLSPEKMSHRSVTGPKPVKYPHAMFFEGMRKVTITLSRACETPAAATATTTTTRVKASRTPRLCRKLAAAHEIASMARKKRPSRLRPKTPSRVRRRKKKKSGSRSHHYAELAGLALVAFGVFLAAVLYGGWSAGVVGGRLTSGLEELVGAAVYVIPLACVSVGGLALVRSRLIDVRPFRLGLAVTSLGLLLVLGDAHGGHLGTWLEAAFGWLLGSTGVLILGAFTLLAGLLLLTGASVGAIVRRSHGAVQNVRRRASERREPRACRGDPARSGPRPRAAARRRRPRLPGSHGDGCGGDRARAGDRLGGHAAVALRPGRGRLRGISPSRPRRPPAFGRHGQGHGRTEHAASRRRSSRHSRTSGSTRPSSARSRGRASRATSFSWRPGRRSRRSPR